jgi:hypothetical protein
MAAQAGRVRSNSLRSSGNVIRCTGFPMAATIPAPISYLYPKVMRASLSWCLVARAGVPGHRLSSVTR